MSEPRTGDELVGGDSVELAVPTVVRRLPAPIRKLVGDLYDSDRILAGLQLPSPETTAR